MCEKVVSKFLQWVESHKARGSLCLQRPEPVEALALPESKYIQKYQWICKGTQEAGLRPWLHHIKWLCLKIQASLLYHHRSGKHHWNLHWCRDVKGAWLDTGTGCGTAKGSLG